MASCVASHPPQYNLYPQSQHTRLTLIYRSLGCLCWCNVETEILVFPNNIRFWVQIRIESVVQSVCVRCWGVCGVSAGLCVCEVYMSACEARSHVYSPFVSHFGMTFHRQHDAISSGCQWVRECGRLLKKVGTVFEVYVLNQCILQHPRRVYPTFKCHLLDTFCRSHISHHSRRSHWKFCLLLICQLVIGIDLHSVSFFVKNGRDLVFDFTTRLFDPLQFDPDRLQYEMVTALVLDIQMEVNLRYGTVCVDASLLSRLLTQNRHCWPVRRQGLSST